MSTALLLWQRKWVLISATGLAMLVAFLITLRLPETYLATSSVLIARPDVAQGTTTDVPSAETFKEIATTAAVIAGALERLGDTAADDDAPLSIDLLRRRMRVETHEEHGQYNSIRISPLLDLNVRDTSAERAAAVANAWAESFREVSRRFRGEGSRQVAQILTERSDAVKGRLLEAEETYRAFQLESMLEILRSEVRVQNEDLAAARATRLDLERQVDERIRMIEALRRELPGPASGAAGEDGPPVPGTLAAQLDRAGEQLVAAMQVLRETRRATDLGALESDLQAVRSRLEGHRQMLVSLEDRRARAVAEVERIEALIPRAAGESDAKALRDSLTAGDGKNPPVSDLVLLERLQDPALQGLRERYYQSRVDAEALGPLIETYRKQIGELRDELVVLGESVASRQDQVMILQERRDRDLDAVRNLEQLRLDVGKELISLGLEADRLRGRASALASRERSLREAAERLQARLIDASLRDEQLRREVEQFRQIHGRLVTRAQEAQAAEAAEASDVALVSRAVIPERPVSPRPLLNLLAAAVFGALASAAFIFLTAGPPRQP